MSYILNYESAKGVSHKNQGAVPLNGFEYNYSGEHHNIHTIPWPLSQANLLSKLSECLNKLFSDAEPLRLMMFASYPNVRTWM